MTEAILEMRAESDMTEFDPFAGGSIERIVPTTEAQREVWLGDQLCAEASLAYNESMVLRFQGALDVDALESAITAVVERHPSLRASFLPDGCQTLIGDGASFAFETRDLETVDFAGRARLLDEARDAIVRAPFSLENGPLFRAALYHLGPDEHVLMLSAHHAVCDGWSWSVISEELGQLYAAQTSGASALDPAPDYADYAAWEADESANPAMRGHIDYWLAQFSGSHLPVLELPLDHPRPAVRTFASNRIDHRIDGALVAHLRRAGQAEGVSLFATLLSSFSVLLNRLTGQDDLVIGIAAAGQLASDMPGLVGHCVNTLPLRVAVDSKQPFSALMRQSSTTVLDAFDHQSLTYGALLKQLPVARDPSRLPLVSVLFNVDQDAAPTQSRFPGLDVVQESIPRAFENFELFINITPVQGTMQIEAQYNCDLFDAQTIQRWLGLYETLLRSVARDASSAVGQIDILSEAEHRAISALQPAATELEGAPLMHAGFVALAAANPERPALRDETNRLNYGELDSQSNQLAHGLRERGIGRGQRVGLCLERGNEMVVALLAVLKAGATYVPLDPAFPQARLDYYAEDAQLSLLLTTSAVASAPRRWCENAEDASKRVLELDLDRTWRTHGANALAPGKLDARAEDPAYVIYTSGSTGKPKGVCVPHRAVANFIQSMQREPGFGPDDRLAAVTTLSFDIAVAELLLPLSTGAEVVLVGREVAMDGQRFAALLESESITVLQATPGMWRLLIDADWRATNGLRGWIGGESVPAELASTLMARGVELWNVYGPTETTVWSTVWRMDREAIAERGMSIGRPMANTGVWILDQNLQTCAIGVPGEICISGMGVTLGYLDRPELTADRFVTVPVAGSDRLVYRTGDRGRWRNDGLLEHMGRLDFQVKVRGYRIELGEIEACCSESAGVARSVVTTREDQSGDVRLVAYLALTPGGGFDQAALERQLRERLPQYMLPQHIVTLEALPQLPNGKIDRKALPAPELRFAPADERLAPRTELERTVLAMMEQVLRLPGLGIRDDFFALGGHSLLAARLATLLSREFAINLPLRTLFESPTAESLSLAIGRLQESGTQARQTIRHLPGQRNAPLTPSQERMRFLEEMHPGRSVYNAPSAHRLSGALDAMHFEAALREIVQRQPALRTRMGVDDATGEAVQITEDSIEFAFPLVDLRALPQDQREAELATQMQELADRPFEIHRAPLFHAALYRLADDDHAFAFVPHHLIWDGWSFDLLQNELSAIYGALERGQPHGLPPVPVNHGDFTRWQADWMRQSQYQAQLDFWKARFSATPTPRAMLTDMPRRAGMSGKGAAEWISIDSPLTDALRALARDVGVTLSMLSFGVYAIMMSRVIDSESIVIANPVRGREAPETEAVMGYFNNVLPLGLQVDPALSLGDFMRYLKREFLSVMDHQQVPFERLVAEPEFTGRVKGAGMYQAMFSYQDARERPKKLGSLGDRQMHLLQSGATDDLGLWLMEKPTGLEGALVYNADLYLRETGVQLRKRYLELLNKIVDEPQASVETLGAAGDSPSAAYLTRLAATSSNAASNSGASQSAIASPATHAPQSAAGALPAVTDEPGARSVPSYVVALLLPEQAQLAQVWASVINIDVNDIRASDTFFDLGGDSLLAMRAIQQAEQVMGFKVEPRRYVFETLGQLASASAAAPASVFTEADGGSEPVVSVPRASLLGRVFGFGRRG